MAAAIPADAMDWPDHSAGSGRLAVARALDCRENYRPESFPGAPNGILQIKVLLPDRRWIPRRWTACGETAFGSRGVAQGDGRHVEAIDGTCRFRYVSNRPCCL